MAWWSDVRHVDVVFPKRAAGAATDVDVVGSVVRDDREHHSFYWNRDSSVLGILRYDIYLYSA